MGFSLISLSFGAATISSCIFYCLLLPLETESMPKLKHVSLSFHMFTYFLNVFLNTDKFLLHYVESEVQEICSHAAGGRSLEESQATFLDQTLKGVLLGNIGKVLPALACWLMMCLKAQTICLSY